MTTMLEEIKQRDASIHQSWFDIYERVLNLDATPDEKVPPPDDAHTALALGDRRWLLARVEELETALNGMIGGFSMDWTGTPLGDRIDAAKKALASLTTPTVSSDQLTPEERENVEDERAFAAKNNTVPSRSILPLIAIIDRLAPPVSPGETQ